MNKTLMIVVTALSLLSPVNVVHARDIIDTREFDVAWEELSKPRYTEITMEISYYTAGDDGMDGQGITASGTVATEGRTVAMGSQYPLGTVIWIDGHRYINEDREDTLSAIESMYSLVTVGRRWSEEGTWQQ